MGGESLKGEKGGFRGGSDKLLIFWFVFILVRYIMFFLKQQFWKQVIFRSERL